LLIAGLSEAFFFFETDQTFDGESAFGDEGALRKSLEATGNE
jgi:hypothetical protein